MKKSVVSCDMCFVVMRREWGESWILKEKIRVDCSEMCGMK